MVKALFLLLSAVAQARPLECPLVVKEQTPLFARATQTALSVSQSCAGVQAPLAQVQASLQALQGSFAHEHPIPGLSWNGIPATCGNQNEVLSEQFHEAMVRLANRFDPPRGEYARCFAALAEGQTGEACMADVRDEIFARAGAYCMPRFDAQAQAARSEFLSQVQGNLSGALNQAIAQAPAACGQTSQGAQALQGLVSLTAQVSAILGVLEPTSGAAGLGVSLSLKLLDGVSQHLLEKKGWRLPFSSTAPISPENECLLFDVLNAAASCETQLAEPVESGNPLLRSMQEMGAAENAAAVERMKNTAGPYTRAFTQLRKAYAPAFAAGLNIHSKATVAHLDRAAKSPRNVAQFHQSVRPLVDRCLLLPGVLVLEDDVSTAANLDAYEKLCAPVVCPDAIPPYDAQKESFGQYQCRLLYNYDSLVQKLESAYVRESPPGPRPT